MRRIRQKLTWEETDAILRNGDHGVLALVCEDGMPYALPISYAYDGKIIYFHCAKSGMKLEAIDHEPRASFCVVAQDEILPERYTTLFRSAIAFGEIHRIEDSDEKRRALELLCDKYAPEDTRENRNYWIDKDFDRCLILEMKIDLAAGKQSIELVKQNQQ